MLEQIGVTAMGFFEALLAFFISLAANGTTVLVESRMRKDLDRALQDKEALRHAIAARRPLRDEVGLACMELARNRDRLGITQAEEPLWRLLSDEVFQKDVAEWLMAGAIEEGDAVKARLMESMTAALSDAGASPELIEFLKTGYFQALDRAICSNEILVHWRHQLSLNYLREQDAFLRKKAEEAAGIYSPEKQQEALQRYCEKALAAWDIIDLSNLPEGDIHIATQKLFLRQLYMPLRVIVEIREERAGDEEAFRALEEGREARRMWEAGRRNPAEPESRTQTERFSVGERLNAARRLVILGDPGGGKTTMMRWLATAYLLRCQDDPAHLQLPDGATLPPRPWIPVLIRCRDLGPADLCHCFSDFLNQHLQKSELVPDEANVMKAIILDRIAKGGALLLVDGLDEITDPHVRVMFCQELERTAMRYPEAHMVVTSRIVGYRDMPYRMGTGFEHAIIAELTPGDKDLFARRWIEVTEQHQPSAEKTNRQRELIDALHSSDRIEKLTNNPMLLTTLALVKRKVGKLPKRRTKLYSEAVAVLLNWNPRFYETIDEEEAIPQLEYLAYEMCRRGVQQLKEEEVLDLLDKLRHEYPNVRAIRRRESKAFLELLEARSSILIKSGIHWLSQGRKGKAVWEFRHLTFQEYLAARALLDGRYPGRDRTKMLAQQIAPLAGRMREAYGGYAHGATEMDVIDSWQEALRLVVADCKDDEVDDILHAIATPMAEEDAAKTARPRAVLAARCLAEEPNATEAKAEEILYGLVNQVIEDDGVGPVELTSMDSAVADLGNGPWAPILRKCLVQKFLSQAPDSLGNVGGLLAMLEMNCAPDDEREFELWFENLIQRLGVTDEIDLVTAALTARRAVYVGRALEVPTLAAKLLNLLSANAPVCHAAAWALVSLVRGSAVMRRQPRWVAKDEEIGSLIRGLERADINNSARVCLVNALGFSKDFRATPTLVRMLEDRVQDVRAAAAEALGDLGNVQVAALLIEKLGDSAEDVREAVAGALGMLGKEEAVAPLIEKLQDPALSVRVAAARALGMLGKEEAVTPLIGKLEDSADDMQGDAAEALGMLGKEEAVGPLIDKLEDPDGYVRYAAARALGMLGREDAVAPLIGKLEDPNYYVRETAARALGTLGKEEAVAPLIEKLEDPVGDVRKAAARALGMLGKEEAVGPLIGKLEDSADDMQGDAAEALGMLGKEEAVGPLIDKLEDPKSYVRYFAARALGRLSDGQAVTPLIGKLEDPSASVRSAAAEALGSLGDQQAVQHLRDRLSDTSWDVCVVSAIALERLGDVQGSSALTRFFGHIRPEMRLAAVGALSRTRDVLTQRLLSQDFSGWEQWLDPLEPITVARVARASVRLRITPEKVRSHYEALTEDFHLNLSWRNRH